MFRCQLCQSVVPAGTRTRKITLATRSRTYRSRGGESSGGFRGRGRRNTPKKEFDKGGEGQEIVQEASVCPQCAEKHERETAIQEAREQEQATPPPQEKQSVLAERLNSDDAE